MTSQTTSAAAWCPSVFCVTLFFPLHAGKQTHFPPFCLFAHLSVFKSKRHVRINTVGTRLSSCRRRGVKHFERTTLTWSFLGIREIKDDSTLDISSCPFVGVGIFNFLIFSCLDSWPLGCISHGHTHPACSVQECHHWQLCALPQPFYYAMLVTQVLKEEPMCTYMSITGLSGWWRAWTNSRDFLWLLCQRTWATAERSMMTARLAPSWLEFAPG